MMEIISKLLDVVYTFLEYVCLYRYVEIFYEPRNRDRYEKYGRLTVRSILIICNVLTVIFFNSIVLTSPYTVIVMIVECIVFIRIFWRCDVLNAIAVVGGYFFALSVSGNVEISFIGFLGGEELIHIVTSEQGMYRMVYLLLCGTNWYLINTLLAAWLKKKEINITSIKYIVIISLVGLVGLTFILIQMLSGFNIVITAVLYGYVILLSAGIFIVYFILNSKNLQTRIRLLDFQNEMLEQNYQRISDLYAANAGLLHDMNHHLKTLYYMLQRGEEKEAGEYIESLQITLSDIGMQKWTGINMIDAFLNETEKKAESRGVDFIVDAYTLPLDIDIEKTDMCSLFENLLENAIEAAEKKIVITIKYVHRMLFIRTQNDYQIKPIMKDGRLVTTKKDTARHGLGTQNIEQIVRKYGGTIEYEIQENEFYVNIMMGNV